MDTFVIKIKHNNQNFGQTKKISHNFGEHREEVLLKELDRGIEFVKLAVIAGIKLKTTFQRLGVFK